MTKRDFDEWLSKFRPSISSYDYYIDFAKVVRNVDEIKVELNILNSLIGSKNIEEEFEKIVTKYPETLQCVPLLLAVRGHEIYAQDEEGAFKYNFKKMNYSVEQYKVFMHKTGLFDMIANHLVNNLVDYALGIETGLDSNGRKNRGGHQMEDLVEKYIVAAGFVKDVNYFKEMYLKDIEEKWNIDLSALSNQGSVGNTPMTAFALKNIKGRAGRYYHHSMGRVFYTDSKQRQIENEDELELNFQIYDDKPILKADIDNSEFEDLSENNRSVKMERESKFDKRLLPDKVFIKNRLYSRDVQEKYLNFIMQRNVFQKFTGLIGNTSNIAYFLKNRIINAILETFEAVQILDVNKAKVYYAVISTYSQNGTIGVLKYHVDKVQEKNSSAEEKMDTAYIKTFEQIRNIVEYEVPKLLCLFEALFQQAGVLLGYNMDDFNMSTIIRFFELGITTELGLFLVEFGFPTDTIRVLENKYPAIGRMGAVEAATFLGRNPRMLYNVMDSYEQELYKKAIQVLLKRK